MKIAIYGPMCSGKTTLSKLIQEYNSSYTVFSFGQKVKDLAVELFSMEGKNRSLLINIAGKLREIDPDVWVNYVMNQIKDKQYCIIDDLRYQNELDALNGWTIIRLITPEHIRIKRIKELYPENYEDHIRNMDHISETNQLRFPKGTIEIDGSNSIDVIRETLQPLIHKI